MRRAEELLFWSQLVRAWEHTDVSRRRRGERLVHSALDGQFDVIGVHRGLLGVSGIDLSVFYDGRHIS